MASLKFSINIDCGGTFTDGFLISSGGETIGTKVLTTPYDLTVCFGELLAELAKILNISLDELLSRAEIVRFSTTIGTNTILQRSGPKLGLVVSRGLKDHFLANSAVVANGFLKEEMIEEIDEEVDAGGVVRRGLDEGQVLQIVERLLDSGARYIVVGFRNASRNPVNEQGFRLLVEKNYPKHYLGSIPLLLSTEISKRSDDVIRINTALINAYLHRDMARFLYKADDFVRRHWHPRPLLIGHASGGVARVAKTIALNTYNSGPAAGALGAAHIASLYGIGKMITADMGGTSLDATLIINERPQFLSKIDIEGVKCYGLIVEVNPIAAGGGSIAQVVDSQVEVGPRSAGSLPGPACFETGGIEPTVTDADLVLGFLNPDRFLGGKIRLSVEAAYSSLKDFIAEPLGISVQEAAALVRSTIDTKIASFLGRLIEQRGGRPQDFTLLAYGGAGPTHCCSFAELAGIKRVIIAAQAPFFSAFGLANSRVSHFYEVETGKDLALGVERAKVKAIRDMKGEGFAPDEVRFRLWLAPGNGVNVIVEDSAVEIEKLRQGLEAVLLEASAAVPSWQPVSYPEAGEDAAEAMISQRQVYWANGVAQTPVYDRKLLRPGNKIVGPAIVEADETTYVIPAKWTLTIDTYGNAVALKED